MCEYILCGQSLISPVMRIRANICVLPEPNSVFSRVGRSK